MRDHFQKKNQRLGVFLQRKRLAAGLSQAEVASRLRYTSPQYVSNWERGISAPPMDRLLELLPLYRISKKEIIQVMMDDTRRYLESKLSRSPTSEGKSA